MILNDRQIRAYAEQGMISPYEAGQVRALEDGSRCISYGQSSFGYDIRVGDDWMIFAVPLDRQGIIDPLAFDEHLLRHYTGSFCVIPPNSYALARSIERFRMPRTVTAVAVGKSTLARCGIIVNVTPLEAGWDGVLTIEISNSTSLPAKIYANMGVTQLLFFEGEDPEVSYADRAGKYQGQTGITLPRL